MVREAAGETVGRFSEHVMGDFLDKHKKVVPCLLKVIKDLFVSKHDMTIQKSLFALNEFVQNLENLRNNEDLYNSALTNQQYIKNKYFQAEWLRNYLMTRIFPAD